MARRRRRLHLRPSASAAGLAIWLTFGVIALQVALLVAFHLYPDPPPVRGTLWQGLWARANMPAFYPLLALFIAGPPATALAVSVRGSHRLWLAAAWAAFLPLLIAWHGQRTVVMLEILWKFA